MREYFDEFDEDGSGDIGPDEFKVLCRKLEPDKFKNEEELEAALLELDADGDGEISFDEFATWWEATMAGKVHFSSIALREYDDIFSTSVIKEVVEDGGPKLAQLPVARWVAMAGFVVSTALNTVNIVKAFTQNLPNKAMLVASVQNGSFSASRQECISSGDEMSDDCSELRLPRMLHTHVAWLATKWHSCVMTSLQVNGKKFWTAAS